MKRLFLWSLLLLAAPRAWAAGLPFLQVPSGARAAALAEAAVALPDEEAISANPAALRAAGRTLGLSHGEWVQGIRHEGLTLLFSGGDRVLGLAARLGRAEGLERRTGPSAAPLGEFGVYDGALELAYAQPWNTRLRLGFNLKLIRQSIYMATSTGAALDLGALFQARPALCLGIALRHLGRMNALDRASTSLPRTLALGLTFAGPDRLLLGLELRRTADRASAHLGGEWAATSLLWLRGGYQTADTRGPALGLGLRREAWTLDYAFVPFADDLGEAHRLSLHLYQRGRP